jgi:UDP-2,3-diacylglucosamine hydrolase
LTHGDAWCVGDVEYQQFRRTVRNPAWQAVALATPLAQRRILARGMRSESERRTAEHAGGPWFDVDSPTALQWLTRADAHTLVHGHTHHPGTQALSAGVVRHVLSDWELDGPQVPRAEVLRWQRGSWSRLAPEDAVDHER